MRSLIRRQATQATNAAEGNLSENYTGGSKKSSEPEWCGGGGGVKEYYKDERLDKPLQILTEGETTRVFKMYRQQEHYGKCDLQKVRHKLHVMFLSCLFPSMHECVYFRSEQANLPCCIF